MVMWHIKLKGKISRTGYKLNVYHRIKLVSLGRGKRFNIINWDFRWLTVDRAFQYGIASLMKKQTHLTLKSLMNIRQ